MSGPESRDGEALRQHFRILGAVTGAIVGGVGIFAGVAAFLHYSGAMEPSLESVPVVGTVLFTVAAIVLISAGLIGSQLGPGVAEASPDLVLAKHKTSVIVTLALREGAAFIALVAGLLSGMMELALAIAAVAVVIILVQWPKRAALEGALRRANL